MYVAVGVCSMVICFSAWCQHAPKNVSTDVLVGTCVCAHAYSVLLVALPAVAKPDIAIVTLVMVDLEPATLLSDEKAPHPQ